jgi:hypothetical protein
MQIGENNCKNLFIKKMMAKLECLGDTAHTAMLSKAVYQTRDFAKAVKSRLYRAGMKKTRLCQTVNRSE